MRALIVILLAIVVGYGILQIAEIDPQNYVQIVFANYLIKVSVVKFLILLALATLALYFLFSLISFILRSTTLWSRWRNKRNNQKAQDALGLGYLSLIKGDWSKAEKSLTSKSDHSSIAYVNFLAAAQAAQEQGKIKERDEYLNAAYKAAPKERFAIGLTKARLHQKAGQLDQALIPLNDIARLGAKNPQYLAMLLQTHQELGNWNDVQSLMPVARKHKALPDEMLQEMYHQSYVTQLHNSNDKKTAWAKLPKTEKNNPENVAIYAADLIKSKQYMDAEKLLRNELKISWSDELVALYGSITSEKPAKLMRNVEGWLLARPENAELNLAAGRFAIADKNSQKAIEYLEAAIKFGQLPLAFTLLGNIYETEGDSGKALHLYRSGMQASSLANTRKLNSLQENEINVISGDLVLNENS